MKESSYTNPAAQAFLAGLATAVTEGCIVEIGVFRGQTLINLASHARPGVQVFGVDPWGLEGTYPHREEDAHLRARFGVENMAVVEERAAKAGVKPTLFRAMSVDAANSWEGPPVSLLYVDGDHSEEAIDADLTAWGPHLLPGAVIVFDDYYPGRPGRHSSVRAAVDRWFPDRHIGFDRLAWTRWAS